MPIDLDIEREQPFDEPSLSNYWPAEAARLLRDGSISAVVEMCKEHLNEPSAPLSAHIIYAQALHRAGQLELAADQCYEILARDPENLVAIKMLADIQFAQGDQWQALANYERIFEIDPHSAGLHCNLQPRESKTRTIVLTRAEEPVSPKTTTISVRGLADTDIPFFTETMADLYLAQGHTRHAVEVYRRLHTTSTNPRLAEKLAAAEAKLKEKDN